MLKLQNICACSIVSKMITEIADRYFSLNVIVGPSKISISDIDVTGRRRLYVHALPETESTDNAQILTS